MSLFNSKEFISVDEKFIQAKFKGKTIVDLGTVTLDTEKDKQLLIKYIEALKRGDNFYKPQDLKIQKK